MYFLSQLFTYSGVVTARLTSTCTVSPDHDSGPSLRTLSAAVSGTEGLKRMPVSLLRKCHLQVAVVFGRTMLIQIKHKAYVYSIFHCMVQVSEVHRLLLPFLNFI